MNRYKYKARDQHGTMIKGEVEASSESQAARLIRGKKLILVNIRKVSTLPLSIDKLFRDRVTSGDITTFTREFATMINAGLPITEALLILRAQAKTSMTRIISKIMADVEDGEALSVALEKHPRAFSKTYVALIKSGETGGVMDEVLIRLAENMEKQQEFKGKVKAALIYPVVIVIGMVLVAFIMLIFVIPRLTSLYEQFDADLPVATRLLIKASDLMSGFWVVVLIIFAIIIFAFRSYRKTKIGRKRTDELYLKIPFVGELQKKVMLTELARTLSLMVGSGVSILEGLQITSGVMNNSVMADALDDSSKMVEKGFPVALAFSRHPEAFPFIFSQMLAVGEETGKMDEVLQKLAHIFEVESDQKVKTITSAVEPVILLVLGVGVAFLVVSIIMPIYNLTTQI
ncbi:type II secretion system F family protein [Patescibacteria group bacterium]